MTTELLLDVGSLHAGYGRAEVLHGLNLKAKAGSVVTVIGPNGAGKSTLLNALMGVLPARGRIRYQGKSIALDTLEERVMQGIALVPETRALFGTMAVVDNLLLGAYRQVRLGHKDSTQAIEEVFALFPRLKERRAQAAGSLSGGEAQMVAMGRGIMSEPRILLIDEPSLGLAPVIVKEVLGIVRRLKAEGVTIALIEQNTHLALSVADNVHLMRSGKVLLSQKAAQVDLARLHDLYLAREGGPAKL